ncbi:MAG: ubiquinone/menaquinone biosynthesis methyltransferase [Ignavibacteria bacterium]
MMIEPSKDKQFIGRMFDEISPTYDRLNHLFSVMQDKRWRKKAVNYLLRQNINTDHILDLASGSGDLALEMMKLNPKRIYSVDLSYEMLKINKKKINSARNFILQAEAELLPFRDDFFDVTGIAFGVRNFENLEGCVEEIQRVLKKNGRFLTIEMFRDNSESITRKSFDYYFKKIVPKVGNILSNSDYAYDYLFNSVDSFLTVNEYCSMLANKGFKINYTKNNFLGIVNTVIASKV